MSFRHRLFGLPMPGLLRRACISRLHRLTADAFQAEAPAPHGSARRRLESYAELTRAVAEQAAVDEGRTARARDRLFANARGLGARLRSRLGIRDRQDALEAARSLYRLIGVDFRPSRGSAGFTVPHCFFSGYYSPAVCRMISSLDAGLLSGLTDGAEMSFCRRITEGAASCEGVISGGND
ncbi:MAG TPA: hypothetical protein VMV03_00160 [Spirochaetia bacterium]|nr:hypothetical protein [Spirochaetia bacterium]